MKYTLFFIAIALLASFANPTFSQQDGFQSAKIINGVNPAYPKNDNLRKSGVSGMDSGVVELIYMVDKQGKPFEIMVTYSSLPKFEQEAIQSIAKSVYKPATFDGNPTDSVVTSVVPFKFLGSELRNNRNSTYVVVMGLHRKLPQDFQGHYNKFSKELEKGLPNERKAAHLISKMANLRKQTFNSL